MTFAIPATDTRRQWDLLRIGMFFLVLIFIYIEPNPTSTSFAEAGAVGETEGQLFQQLLWPVLAAIVSLSLGTRTRAFLQQYDLFLIGVLGWLLLTSVFAIEPQISFRRYFFMFFVMQAVMMPMAAIEDHRLIPKCLFVTFGLSTLYAYVYVVALPQHGIHSATGAEPQLVGLWRGQFAHKSIAGIGFAMMALLTLRLKPHFFYAAFFLPLQVLFVIKSGDKTVLILTIPIFILGTIVTRSRNVFAMLAMIVLPIVLICLVTLGSIYVPAFEKLASMIIGDSSFTGRTELWKVLIYYTSLHPITGAGFQSFWQLNTSSPAVFYGGTWLKDAFYGHQSYLDLMATTGIPGLALGILFVLVRPALDLAKIRNRNNPMVAAYVTMWLFPLYQGTTESILFEKTSGSWIFLLMGIVGLRRIVVDESEARRRSRPVQLHEIGPAAHLPQAKVGPLSPDRSLR